MKDHLFIFDTTLRDGEQSPGASMTREEKIRVARQLEKMRVDVIEADAAVDAWFASAEHVEVRPVEHENLHCAPSFFSSRPFAADSRAK